jgi:predicted TIM-barrel fold metal-dependent hydrolase
MTGWSRSMYEFFFDTTRALINVVFSGTLARNPGIELIVPHAGAALPALAQRVERNVWAANRRGRDDELPGFVESLRRCWFDLAGSPSPFQLPSLLALVGADRLLYGSDWPFTGADLGAELTAEIRTTDLLSASDRIGVLRANASKLFPALATVTAS